MEEELMELLMWLEQIEIWRLQREHGSPKLATMANLPQDEVLPVASYPEEQESLSPVG
jgi:hypothetical protein